jgi:hypothetical protein
MKKMPLEFASILSTGLGLFLLSTIQVSAQPLVMNTPTNISINPADPLPATNGTASISTEGVTDTDMNVIPPEGVTVIISNDTVTVTNQAVDIATAEEEAAGDEEDEGAAAGGAEEEGGGTTAGGAEEEEEEEEPGDETEEVDTE